MACCRCWPLFTRPGCWRRDHRASPAKRGGPPSAPIRCTAWAPPGPPSSSPTPRCSPVDRRPGAGSSRPCSPSIRGRSAERSTRSSRRLVNATPLIFTGLSVALGFRVGLFNIGGEGQFLHRRALRGHAWASRSTACRGSSTCRWPFWPASWAARPWGFIPGILKARTGAHEVIITIMINYIAFQPGRAARSMTRFQARAGPPDLQVIEPSAQLPRSSTGLRVHWGICHRPGRRRGRAGCCSDPPGASNSARWAPTPMPRATPASTSPVTCPGHDALRRRWPGWRRGDQCWRQPHA